MYNYLQEQIEIYSTKSFKRLGEKTQIIANLDDKNVHISNRLTHSLEVSVVAQMISEKLPNDLNINKAQIVNICLLHDIGHPSLGHFLEEKLHNILKDTGFFFEGNANNFVIIEKDKIPLSNKTLVSLIKYPQELNTLNKKGIYSYQFQNLIYKLIEEYVRQQKGFIFNGYSSSNKEQLKYIEKNLLHLKNITNEDISKLSSLFPNRDIRTLESKIMEAADDIAYLTHDLSDFLTHTAHKRKSVVQLKNIIDISKYDDGNPLTKYLYVIDSENSKRLTNTIRKIFINNITFDFESSNLKLISNEIEVFKLTLRKLLLEEFIYPETDILEKKFEDNNIEKKYFSGITNSEFVNNVVISTTYKNLINNTDNIEKKYRYMANYLAEKTDKWLF